MARIKWSNPSFEGRFFRRAFTLAVAKLIEMDKAYEADATKLPDLNDLDLITKLMERVSGASLAIIKVHDHDKRLSNIEQILKAIPKDVGCCYYNYKKERLSVVHSIVATDSSAALNLLRSFDMYWISLDDSNASGVQFMLIHTLRPLSFSPP